jgi:hypothetical protein
MRGARRPWAYLLFVLLTGAQLGLFVLAGVLSHVSTHGSEFMLVLIVALAFRSRIAWTLLVLLNAIPLLAVLMAPLGSSSSTGSGHVLWGHLALMLITGIALEATLLSPAMRRFVGRRDARHHSGRRPALQ